MNFSNLRMFVQTDFVPIVYYVHKGGIYGTRCKILHEIEVISLSKVHEGTISCLPTQQPSTPLDNLAEG